MAFESHATGYKYPHRFLTSLGKAVRASFWEDVAKNLHTLWELLGQRELANIGNSLKTTNTASPTGGLLTGSPATDPTTDDYCVFRTRVKGRKGQAASGILYDIVGQNLEWEIWMSDSSFTAHSYQAGGTMLGVVTPLSGTLAGVAGAGDPYDVIISLFIGKRSGSSNPGDLYSFRVLEGTATVPSSP